MTSPAPRPEVFASKVDAWLVALLGLGLAIALLSAVGAWPMGGAPRWIAFGTVAAVLLALACLVWPCRYSLRGDRLLIRAGLVRQEIPYEDITGISASSELWSAPALSLQRVRIDFGPRFQLVSPVDRSEFMTRLAAQVADHRRSRGLPEVPGLVAPPRTGSGCRASPSPPAGP